MAYDGLAALVSVSDKMPTNHLLLSPYSEKRLLTQEQSLHENFQDVINENTFLFALGESRFSSFFPCQKGTFVWFLSTKAEFLLEKKYFGNL